MRVIKYNFSTILLNWERRSGKTVTKIYCVIRRNDSQKFKRYSVVIVANGFKLNQTDGFNVCLRNSLKRKAIRGHQNWIGEVPSVLATPKISI